MTLSPLTMHEAPDEKLLQSCVHCGLCLPTCPTYAVLGQEADSPRGRISLMKFANEGRLAVADPAYDEHIYACLGCRACETACPSGVEFGKLLEGARAGLEAGRTRSASSRAVRAIALRGLLPHHAPLALLARTSVLMRKVGLSRALGAAGRLSTLSRRLAGLLDLVPDRVSARELPAMIAARGARRGTAALFTGCVMRAAFADTNLATARVLAANGIEVLVPRTQTCCGALHAHAGEPQAARDLARRNIAALEQLAVDAFVVNAAGCGAAIKEYGWLLRDDPAWAERAKRFSARVRDASEYLAEVGLSATPGRLEVTVTYDDPCHLLHGQKISAQPRALIEAIPGIRLVPLAEADWCCGSAGIYNVTRPEMSRQLLERKMTHVLATGAALLVTANPGCSMQLAAGLRAARSPMEVVHLMDLLDRAYRSPS